MAQVKEEQIPVNSKIVIPAGMPISFDDSIIIFGNMFDNAMDACKKVLPQNRYIRLELAYIHHALFIGMSNSMSSLDKTVPINDCEEHGFGLKNIHTVVQKYNGTMDMEEADNTFTLKLVLYNLNSPQ